MPYFEFFLGESAGKKTKVAGAGKKKKVSVDEQARVDELLTKAHRYEGVGGKETKKIVQKYPKGKEREAMEKLPDKDQAPLNPNPEQLPHPEIHQLMETKSDADAVPADNEAAAGVEVSDADHTQFGSREKKDEDSDEEDGDDDDAAVDGDMVSDKESVKHGEEEPSEDAADDSDSEDSEGDEEEESEGDEAEEADVGANPKEGAADGEGKKLFPLATLPPSAFAAPYVAHASLSALFVARLASRCASFSLASALNRSCASRSLFGGPRRPEQAFRQDSERGDLAAHFLRKTKTENAGNEMEETRAPERRNGAAHGTPQKERSRRGTKGDG